MTDISLQETATTVKRSSRSTVCEGAVRKSRRSASRLDQPVYSGGAAVARWRSNGAEPQGGRTRPRRRSDGIAALSRPHRRAAPRPVGRARSAADQQRGRHPWRDKGGRRRGRARRHHPRRRVRAVQMIESFLRAIDASDFETACGNWRTRRRQTVQILTGIRPAKDLSLSHTPDTAEDSKPTAELPLLLRPAVALQPRISAAERSRSLYFRCKKQRKQLVSESFARPSGNDAPSHQIPLHRQKPVPAAKLDLDFSCRNRRYCWIAHRASLAALPS